MLRMACAGLAIVVALGASSAPRRYASGTILPSHRTRAQLDEDLRAYYAVWKTNFLKDAGPNLYRVSFGSTNPGRTVSEGQGYGMMIAALIAGYDPDARRIFDGLWRFARKYPSSADARLMSWQVPPGDSDSAFDGDADIAYALLLAHSQWGSDGEIDYRAAAKIVIAGILESTIGPDSRLPMLGDWVNPNGEKYNQFTTRPSDFMPEHFRAFLRATGNPAWTRVIAETQALVTSLQSLHDTGLLPDFVVRGAPAPAHFLEAETDGDYSYNAGRVPWRLGIDALLNGDAVSRTQARRISEWARVATNGDPLRLRGGYRLDGTMIPGRDYFTIFFAAPIGVAAMNEPAQQEWLNDVYDAVRARHEDYYEDSVTLLCMFAMTGNAWRPEGGRRRGVRH
ncbi:MAG TPA: glycosyl hydrolase family 8 [Thermoanaerobaculia bacterium]|jgi:endo-1,4-beta-D-glucanase Y|nr:glycosyl hydrolase family 8 [Thermoanaerobaculia bacterium]